MAIIRASRSSCLALIQLRAVIRLGLPWTPAARRCGGRSRSLNSCRRRSQRQSQRRRRSSPSPTSSPASARRCPHRNDAVDQSAFTSALALARSAIHLHHARQVERRRGCRQAKLQRQRAPRWRWNSSATALDALRCAAILAISVINSSAASRRRFHQCWSPPSPTAMIDVAPRCRRAGSAVTRRLHLPHVRRHIILPVRSGGFHSSMVSVSSRHCVACITLNSFLEADVGSCLAKKTSPCSSAARAADRREGRHAPPPPASPNNDHFDDFVVER